MDQNFYQQIVKKASLGYAYHKIILDEKGVPIDYEFLDVNENFVRLTGLTKEQLLNQRATHVMPALAASEFDWIAFYGKVALTGEEQEFEQYSEKLDKYYHTKAYSPQKNYFVTLFTDISNQIHITNISKHFIEDSESEIDYQKITDDMVMLSGAKYAAFNLFDKDACVFKTMVVSGRQKDIKKALDFLNINVIGKQWEYNPIKEDKVSGNTLTYFDSLHQISKTVIPEKITKSLEKLFTLGQVVVVKIKKDGYVLGEFILMMPKNKPLKYQEIVKIYASQVALYIEKQKNKTRLRQSQKKYKELASQVHIGVVSCNLDGGITFVNSRLTEILGSPSIEETKKINLLTYPPLVEQGLSHYIKESMEQDKIVSKETTYVSKWNKKSWFRAHIKPQKENGKVIGARIIVDDITETRQIKDKLKASEENFRSLVETINDMIFVGNPQGQIVYSNQAVQKKLGYSPKETQTMTLLDFHAKNHRQEANEILSDLIDGKLDYCPLPLESKDNRIVPVESRVWFGQWNGKESIFGISKDISKEQEALQKFNRFFKSNPALMAVSDIESKSFTEVNDALLEILGYSREELIGKKSEEVDLFPELEKQQKIADELIKNGHVHNCELKVKTKNGKLLDGLFSGEVIKSQGKQYFLTVMLDITELKKSQEKIKFLSYHDQLTGLYNRRYYDETLNKINNQANLPLSTVMIDVNGLKLFNDAFGHQVGDQLLRKVAGILKQQCQTQDVIARLGGDEFIIILPSTNEQQVDQRVKEIKKQINRESIKKLHLSVSFGWSTMHDCAQNIQTVIKEAEAYMYKNKLSESASMRNKSITVIMKTLYEKNEREEIHSKRVSQLCYQIGGALKLNEDKKNELRLAGLMHDIGKIVVDTMILDKEGALTEEQWRQIKKHPEVGYQILRSVDEYATLSTYVLAHHERWDGTGYPKGLKEEEIPYESRIIAIADTFDAMTNDRPYRKGLSKEVAIEEIKKNSGTQFDPKIVEAFIK